MSIVDSTLAKDKACHWWFWLRHSKCCSRFRVHDSCCRECQRELFPGVPWVLIPRHQTLAITRSSCWPRKITSKTGSTPAQTGPLQCPKRFDRVEGSLLRPPLDLSRYNTEEASAAHTSNLMPRRQTSDLESPTATHF